MTPFRFAIIGAGKIAHKFCDAARMAGCEIAAVASKSQERAAAFAEEEGIPSSFGDYAVMLDTVRPDAVYIATTHNFHYENLKLCLSRKIPILCEKPMTCTRKEAEEIFAEAKKQGVFVMEAMWSRFLPHIQRAKKWMEEGKIGTPRLATSVVAFRADYDPASRLFNPALAGGAMWDVGVYAVELLTYLLGEQPSQIEGMIFPAETGADLAATVNLKFSTCLASVQTSVVTCTAEGITIGGSEGYIWIPHANIGREAFLYDRKGQIAEHFIQDYPNGFVWEVEEAVHCIREGLLESPTISWEDTLGCAEIFDRVLGNQ
ncbi:MAG: Gfo/Idh/MocA family protein [Candidatus Merdivicinus sp.]|jgi:predicted dehydrogenase